LIKENKELNKKYVEIKKEKESLAKRCDDFRRNCDMLKNMLQMNPGKVKLKLMPLLEIVYGHFKNKIYLHILRSYAKYIFKPVARQPKASA